jgi:hypothetical protein
MDLTNLSTCKPSLQVPSPRIMDSKAMKAVPCGRSVEPPPVRSSSPAVGKVDTSILGSRKRACQSLEQLDDIAEILRQDEDISFHEKQRKMAIIYSRRKRLRSKQKLRELEEWQKALLADNERVRRENDQLDAVIRRSVAIIALQEQERISSVARLAQAVRVAQRQSALADLVAPSKDMALMGLPSSQALTLDLLATQRLKALQALAPPAVPGPQETFVSKYLTEHDFVLW